MIQYYDKIFNCLPQAYVILAPDAPRFTILQCNTAYEKAVGKKSSELNGRGLFEVFPDNPDNDGKSGNATVFDNLMRVLISGQPYKSSITRYDLIDHEGNPEPRWWVSDGIPISDDNKNILCIVQGAIDVTHLVEQGLIIK